jgi:hypothetical protein
MSKDSPCIYRIVVEGALDADWSNWLGGLSVKASPADPGSAAAVEAAPCTALTGLVRDQAALRSILTRLWNMNLIVVSVNRVETPPEGGSHDC